MTKNVPKCNRTSKDRCIQCNFPRAESIHYFRKDSEGRPLCNRCGLLNLRKKRKRGGTSSITSEETKLETAVHIESHRPNVQPGPLESTRDIELDVASLLQDMDSTVPSLDPFQTRPVLFLRGEQKISHLFTNWIVTNPNERECIEALLEALRVYGERRLHSS